MEKSGGGSAPTGCYKCGRPGHWSRDCPSNPNTTITTTTTSTNTSNPNNNTTSFAPKAGSDASASKPKKVPRTIPKLTPDLLLSDKGLGYVLRHFPRAFRFRGRAHEVADLGHLLSLYAEWHAGLLPYYSFDQFIHKVEKLGGSKRVKLCMKGLRDRVADGVDPTKLYEPQVQEQETNNQQEVKASEPTDYPEETMQDPNPKDFQETMLNDVWESVIEEPSQPSHEKIVAADTSSAGKETSQATETVTKTSGVIQISEEQRARMEANKLKALQRAAARTTHIKST